MAGPSQVRVRKEAFIGGGSGAPRRGPLRAKTSLPLQTIRHLVVQLCKEAVVAGKG